MIAFLVAMVVLVVVGTLLWRVMAAQAADGEPRASGADAPTSPTRTSGPTRPIRPSHGRPVAPDDDPDFLRSLDDRLRRPGPEDPSGHR